MPRQINNDRCIQLSERRPEPYFVAGRTAYFGSGREALVALAEALHIGPGKTVLLPAYVPEGIFRPLEISGCRIVRYQLDENLDPVWENLEALLTSAKPVLAVQIHYFGLEKAAARFLQACRRHGSLMLEDLAHILPTAACAPGRWGDYVLYSPTKVVGVPDGGILVARSEDLLVPKARAGFGILRMLYLCQQVGLLLDATIARYVPTGGRWVMEFRRLFERVFLNSYRTLMQYYRRPHAASRLSRWLLQRCDWEDWAAKRRDHAERYASGLDPVVFRRFRGGFPAGAGPFAFPVLVDDRESLQRFLRQHAVAGLVNDVRWDFIPAEERASHPATLAFLKEHFLFPTNQCLSGAEVAKVVALANAWASEWRAGRSRTGGGRN